LPINAEHIGRDERFAILFNDLPEQLREFLPKRRNQIRDAGAFFQVKWKFGLPGQNPGNCRELDKNLNGIHLIILVKENAFAK